MPRSKLVASEALLTVDEAASRLGVSAKTVWRFLSQGKLTRKDKWSRTVVGEAEVDALKRERAKA